MYSLWGLLGCSMDFVSLHYQFSSIEFYEPNTMQQEANIKRLAWFLNQTWLSSCFRLLNCLHLLFLVPELVSWLGIVPRVISFGCWWRHSATSKEMAPRCFQYSKPWFTLHRLCLCSVTGLLFVARFLSQQKTWERVKEGWKITLPWTGYSQFDESISYIVCRNIFSTALLLV